MRKSITIFPLVSVITINYNQSQVTLELLRSLRKITYPNVEIIVVDNASPTDNPQRIKETFPEIKLIISKKNLGFAGGNNLGIKASKGEYLLFVNNDTEVSPRFIEPLTELLQSNPAIGMVSPKIKFHWNPELIQYAGYTKMNPYTVRNNSIGYHQKDEGQFNKIKETNSVHGAAMMVPRAVVEKAGLMPEIYFLYYEEHDWAEMIKREGYKIYYQPNSFILHKESVSTGKESPLKTYYINRNRMIFARRNFKGMQRLTSMLFLLFISFPKNSLKYLVSGKFNHLAAYLRAVGWNFTHFKSVNNNIKL
ncbi:MAG: glycosyltransferase family 2 protein [Prolixibacteraceae bacterium]|nr:glycosyltransferase family 2 protein [Prolixibacteraceae bacterium]